MRETPELPSQDHEAALLLGAAIGGRPDDAELLGDRPDLLADPGAHLGGERVDGGAGDRRLGRRDPAVDGVEAGVVDVPGSDGIGGAVVGAASTVVAPEARGALADARVAALGAVALLTVVAAGDAEPILRRMGTAGGGIAGVGGAGIVVVAVGDDL